MLRQYCGCHEERSATSSGPHVARQGRTVGAPRVFNEQVPKLMLFLDLIDKLFKVAVDRKDFTLVDVTTEAWVAIFRGSDTTAIAMYSIFYYLMKNLATYEKLVTEIDTMT